jgi:hypothetical protein
MKIKKTKFLIFFFALPFQIIFGQSTVIPNIKSPNTAAMEKFGEIPVSLFTGTPDISIPLHTIESGSIKVPISLSYHSGSMKPNVNPGWVGLGWNLNSYGSISRQVRKSPDEIDFAASGWMANVRSYYPAPHSMSTASSKDLQASDWFTKQKLNGYADYTTYYANSDIEADEFSFNFLGYSGKFYYDGLTEKWVIVSNENIKIEVDGFISFIDRLQALDKYIGLRKDLESNGLSSLTNQFQGQDAEKSRAFGGFTLTTEDGTKYSFGGKDAVEFTSYYYSARFNDVNTNTWLLNKITDIKGNIIDFKYERHYANCNLYNNYYFGSLAWWNLNNDFLDVAHGNWFSSSNSNSMKLTGSYIYPLTLTKIISKNETVEFSSAVATTLRYPADVIKLNLKDVNPDSPTSYPYLENFNYNTDYLQWEKLTGINVVSNISKSSVKGYTFSYFENANQRFALKSVEQSIFYNETKKYSFTYDGLESLPVTFMGPITDHWGFYNNNNNGAFGSSFSFDTKNTNLNYVTLGLLKTITYPTKGYTEFDWESNNYSKVVAKTRDKLDDYTGFGGGCRIKEIRSFSDVNVLGNKKHYYYLKGYSSAININALPSSGVLNGIPKYVFKTTVNPIRLSLSGNYKVQYSETSQNTVSNYSYTGQGAPVGYDEVVEVNLDGSYTKHYFTNYGTDLNNITHYDQLPLGTTGWVAGDDSYMPFSSLESERGKEIGTYDYNSSNKLIKSNTFIFRNDLTRFDEYIRKVVITRVCPIAPSDFAIDSFVFAVGIKNFTYDYYPIKKVVTSYDINGTNPIVETKMMSYNSKNQLASETGVTSTGASLTNYYYYPQDPQVVTLPYVADLIVANRIGTPLKAESYRGVNKITDKIIVYDKDATTLLLLPKNEYSANFPNNNRNITTPPVGELENKITYDKYDSNGNILQYTPAGGTTTVLLWGYNKSLPIAKIENAAYNDVVAYESNLQTLSNSNNETNLIAALNTMRVELPNAMITTYTHIPIIGISTITDPKGDQITYTYFLGKLQFVKDKNGNILKENQYHYKN